MIYPPRHQAEPLQLSLFELSEVVTNGETTCDSPRGWTIFQLLFGGFLPRQEGFSQACNITASFVLVYCSDSLQFSSKTCVCVCLPVGLIPMCVCPSITKPPIGWPSGPYGPAWPTVETEGRHLITCPPAVPQWRHHSRLAYLSMSATATGTWLWMNNDLSPAELRFNIQTPQTILKVARCSLFWQILGYFLVKFPSHPLGALQQTDFCLTVTYDIWPGDIMSSCR